jgi:hypothetical protein
MRIKTKSELARKLSIARNTLDKFLAMKDAPGATRAGFDVEAVSAFIRKHADNLRTSTKVDPKLAELRALELKLKCERLEVLLSKEKGDCLSKAKVLADVKQLAQLTKAVLRQKLETELPPKLAGCSVVQIAAAMAKTVDEVCAIMQNDQTYGEPRESDATK